MADEEQRLLLQKHLGKSYRKHFRSIIRDLMLVCTGLKPSLLFDYGFVKPDKMLQLLQDLHSTNGFSDYSPFGLIIFGEDIFICEPSRIVQLMEYRLRQTDYALVDVSGHLSDAQMLQDHDANQISHQFSDLLKQIEMGNSETNRHDTDHITEASAAIFEESASILDRKRTKAIFIDLKPDWNLSTMFGFLLGYPVIYWFDMKTEHICLSMVPLNLFRVSIIKTLNLSNSSCNLKIPSAAFIDTDDHIVFSFSAPQSLFVFYEKHVSKWKEDLIQLSNSIARNWKLKIDQRVVVQHHVVL